MMPRPALAAGVRTQVGNPAFPETRITEYLRNGANPEFAPRMPNHESAPTTRLSDRPDDQMSRDEVERILI